MLVDWNPNAHGMSLHQTVELVYIEAIINVSLEPHNILNSTVLVPVMNFMIKPPIFFEKSKALLTSQKLVDKQVHHI